MSGAFKVGDEFRTNPLSLKPGGSTVTVHYLNQSPRIYDKIKRPKSYISSLAKLSDAEHIIKIEVDGKTYWERSEMEKNFF